MATVTQFALDTSNPVTTINGATDLIVVSDPSHLSTGQWSAVRVGSYLEIEFDGYGKIVVVDQFANATPVAGQIQLSNGRLFSFSNSLSGAAGNDILVGTSWGEGISGGTGNDLLFAGMGNDTLSGGEGNDELYGGSDNDTLTGGLGLDTFVGGLGDDTYVIDRAGELVTLTENADAGSDTLKVAYANASTTVAQTISLSGVLSEVEHVTISGTGLFNVTGNALDNVLTGNGSANVLEGGVGNDTLIGLAGNDTLIGGCGERPPRWR